MSTLKYTGEALLAEPVKIPEFAGKAPETIYPYLPESELVKAVNVAVLLKRPLLLMGEPGGGKSRLAQALAFELFHQQNENASGEVQVQRHYRDWFFTWNIKSTSRAKDGLYEFDAVRRLRDAQLQEHDLDISKYIRLGPMGQAFQISKTEQERPVLLIDEIDKADIDFPNDLLNELDLGAFFMDETGENVIAQVKPIVIITSNQERELPDAFLRRCVYHYIKPLGEEELRRIVLSRFYPESERKEDALKDKKENRFLEEALELFLKIREDIKNNRTGGKNVSTSELLDWYEALKKYSALITELEVDRYLQPMVTEIRNFREGKGGIPLKQALFKNWETIIDFENRAQEYVKEQSR